MRQLTHRQKNTFLLSGVGVLLLLVYFVSIRPTINLYQSVVALKAKAQLVTQAPEQERALKAELAALNGGGFDSENRGALLGEITQFCEANHLSINQLPVADVFEEGNYRVESRDLVVEGGMQEILELVYLIEYKKSLGVVSSLNLLKEKDRKTRKQKLTGTIVLRSIL